MKSDKDLKAKVAALRHDIQEHNYRYYVDDNPLVTDKHYDLLFRELVDLEESNPSIVTSDSPTQRVGGAISKTFKTVKHHYPMFSLDNSYSKDDLESFNDRILKKISENSMDFMCELKFDGVSINITYENGEFVRAVTRGDGVQGDDVSENVKTIKTIPLK